MKYLQKSNFKLNHLVMGAIRLMKRNGAQCAVLLWLTKSDAAKYAVFELRCME